MNMLEIAFSTDWFLTIPGLLITCGVILLIIALIMFIVSSSKGKGNKNVPAVFEDKSEVPVVQEPVIEEKKEEVTSVETTPVETAVEEPETTPDQDIVALDDSIPTFETITPEEIDTKDEVVPEVNETIPETITFEPLKEETTELPKEEVELPNVDEIPTIEIKEEIPTETISEFNPVEHHTIYGGADPLEATQTLPKIDVHHEPYSGGLKEVDDEIKIVEPIIEEEKKEEQPIITEISNDDFEENIPEVVAIPDDIEEL